MNNCKYIIIIPDGMADLPIAALGGKTPLKFARTPMMDFLCRNGIYGKTLNTPENMEPASDVAIMSILGYSPQIYYSGRGPIEAASRDIKLQTDEFALRCNLINVKDAKINDYSADHITTQEAEKIIKYLKSNLDSEMLQFFSGVSYRHLIVTKYDFSNIKCFPPHDHLGEDFEKYLPQGRNSEILKDLIFKSQELLADFSVNMQRENTDTLPANSIWPWSAGRQLIMPTFYEKYKMNGAVISAVDLVEGLGKLVGLSIIKVDGATGLIDTNYKGKVEASLDAFSKYDFIILHLEGIDEEGHMGNLENKIKGIELLDERVVKPIFDGLREKYKNFCIMILPDHLTPLSIRTHKSGFVPFLIYDSVEKTKSDVNFSENAEVSKSEFIFSDGAKLMNFFLYGK